MKDPLNTQETPYDVLNLKPGAEKAAITEAFKSGLTKSREPQKLTKAKTTLQRPDERFLLDFLYYDPASLGRLNPNPLVDSSVLSLKKRSDTAAAWEAQLQKEFPAIDSLHSLTILWYWWAWYLASDDIKEKAAEGQKSSEAGKMMSLESAWKRVVAYWVTLSRNLDSWSAASGLSSELYSKAPLELETKLRNDFHALEQKHRDRHQPDLVELYQQMDLDLKTELMTAKKIERVGIHTAKGTIVCGRLMLELVGLLKLVNDTIDEQLKQAPDSEELLELHTALSAHSSIAILINNNKPKEALKALDKLSAKEKRTIKVKNLKSRALMIKGEQQSELNKIEEALMTWREALENARDKKLKAKIKNMVVTFCQRNAATLKIHRRDEAINLLDQGLAIVKDKKLHLVLGDVLAERGIENFNNAREKIVDGKETIAKAVINLMETALEDLRRAAKLGSKRASEQLQLAEETFKVVRFRPELDRANAAAEKKDWNTAVTCLEKVLRKVSLNPPDFLTKNLATCLYNRAVDTVMNAQKNNADRTVLIEAIESGLSDLRQAARHKHKEAKEQIKVFEKLLENAKHSSAGLNEIKKALERKDWDEAIDHFERALAQSDGHNEDQIQKPLSVFYNNRAVETINRFIEELKKFEQQKNTAVKAIIKKMAKKSRRGKDCGLCGQSKQYSFGESWYTFGEGKSKALLCSNCATVAQEAMKQIQAAKIGDQERQLLHAAYGSLLRALELDRNNQAAQRSMEDLKQLYEKIGDSLPSKAVAQKAAESIREKKLRTPAKKALTRWAAAKAKRVSADASNPRSAVMALLIVVVFAAFAFAGVWQIYPLVKNFVEKWMPSDFMGLIPLAGFLVTIFLFKYFWQKIGRKRWKQKSFVQKVIEVGLYSTILVVMGYILGVEDGWERMRAARLVLDHAPWIQRTQLGRVTSSVSEQGSENDKTPLSISEPIEPIGKISRQTVESSNKMEKIKGAKRLEIPTASKKPSKANAKGSNVNPPKANIYIVRAGDTLSAICRRHGISLEELCRMNKIKSDDRIVPDQQLIVKATGN